MLCVCIRYYMYVCDGNMIMYRPGRLHVWAFIINKNEVVVNVMATTHMYIWWKLYLVLSCQQDVYKSFKNGCDSTPKKSMFSPKPFGFNHWELFTRWKHPKPFSISVWCFSPQLPSPLRSDCNKTGPEKNLAFPPWGAKPQKSVSNTVSHETRTTFPRNNTDESCVFSESARCARWASI